MLKSGFQDFTSLVSSEIIKIRESNTQENLKSKEEITNELKNFITKKFYVQEKSYYELTKKLEDMNMYLTVSILKRKK